MDTVEEKEQKRQIYFDRLNYEIDIIVKMGFPGYFLIVADFIQWAKGQGIPVGSRTRIRRRISGGLVLNHH